MGILDRVLFVAKVEPAKTEPGIKWSEIESRLREISAPAEASGLALIPSLPIESSITLAHDSDSADELFVAKESPASISGDSRKLLAMLAAIPSNRSQQNFSHQSDCREAS